MSRKEKTSATLESTPTSVSETFTQLHHLLVQELLARIQAGEAAPALLDVARKFLKDNGIESVATSGSHLDALMQCFPTLEEVEESHLYDKKNFTRGH